MATKRVAEVQKALQHIPAGATTPAEVDRLAVWLAARRGDVASERRALERLVADAPADLTAWKRWAELAGQLALGDAFQKKKTELDQAQKRYLERSQRNQPLRDAAELGRLAEQLGDWFEARVYLTIAALVEPNREKPSTELARSKQRELVDAPPSLNLAQLLARQFDVVVGAPSLSVVPAGGAAAAIPSH
jgi:hypothetical protein